MGSSATSLLASLDVLISRAVGDVLAVLQHKVTAASRSQLLQWMCCRMCGVPYYIDIRVLKWTLVKPATRSSLLNLRADPNMGLSQTDTTRALDLSDVSHWLETGCRREKETVKLALLSTLPEEAYEVHHHLAAHQIHHDGHANCPFDPRLILSMASMSELSLTNSTCEGEGSAHSHPTTNTPNHLTHVETPHAVQCTHAHLASECCGKKRVSSLEDRYPIREGNLMPDGGLQQLPARTALTEWKGTPEARRCWMTNPSATQPGNSHKKDWTSYPTS